MLNTISKKFTTALYWQQIYFYHLECVCVLLFRVCVCAFVCVHVYACVHTHAQNRTGWLSPDLGYVIVSQSYNTTTVCDSVPSQARACTHTQFYGRETWC